VRLNQLPKGSANAAAQQALGVFEAAARHEFVGRFAESACVEPGEMIRRDARDLRGLRDEDALAGMRGEEVSRTRQTNEAIVIDECAAHR
jgi:hypothetical protein